MDSVNAMITNIAVSLPVRALIENRLTSIADQYQVNIVYACESGSRAWGFPSPDSDYDVRFIYSHPPSWYLSVEEARDVIELPLENNVLGLLDMGGWDLRKTLRLAGKSNPVIWEWLQSPILYQAGESQFINRLRTELAPFFSPIAACHHYLSITRHTMERELKDNSVKIKKYFYMLRSLLAAAWIEQYRTVPPMEFGPLLSLCDSQSEIRGCIDELLLRKQQTDEQIPIARIAAIDDFLVQELARLQVAAKILPSASGDLGNLDRLFRYCLGMPE